jgi:uncharacterized protein YvpB
MNRVIRVGAFGAAMSLVASFAPLAAPVSAESLRSVTSWIQLSSTRPASGCTIELGIEVRDSGNPVSSTEVALALFDDEELISSDVAVTDSEGVAQLAVETGGGSGNGWLDINVGGGYLTGVYIGLAAGDSCSDGADFLTVEGDVPDVTVAAESRTSEGADGVFVSGVPFYTQERNLSCEYASLYIATAAYGNGISEYAFDDAVGWSPNPHWGYRGNITGWWGNTTDYGVYAEPLAAALPNFGFYGEVFYSGGDTEILKAKIDADVPVLVWLGLWGDQVQIDETDGVAYAVTAGMHVVVAYGYDDDGVWVSDPAIGGARHYTWSDFIYMYSVLDGMSLAVYPA